jgi:hypothetical protein
MWDYEYSLDAIWNTLVTKEDIISGRQKQYEHFEKEGDTRVADLIYRATITDIDIIEGWG